MDASLIPYRKVTSKAEEYLNNESDINELNEVIEKSMKSLEMYGEENENYKIIKEWQLRITECINNSSKTDEFKNWVNSQHVFTIKNS